MLPPCRTSISTTRLCAVKEPAAFEFQELRVLLDAMVREKRSSKSLNEDTKEKICQYMRKIIQDRPSPVGGDELAARLPGSQWRLVFSTEPSMETLPNDASATLTFNSESEVDYTLLFGPQTWGLNALRASSRWTANEYGTVSITYEKVNADAFSMKSIGVGFFGLLAGRTTYIQSAYFDGSLWLERALGQDGSEIYLSAYLIDDKDW